MRVIAVVPLLPASEVAQAYEEGTYENGGDEAEEQEIEGQDVFDAERDTQQQEEDQQPADGSTCDHTEAYRVSRGEPLSAIRLCIAAQARVYSPEPLR